MYQNYFKKFDLTLMELSMNNYICGDMGDFVNQRKEFFMTMYVIDQGSNFIGEKIDDDDILTNLFETKDSAINFLVTCLSEDIEDTPEDLNIEEAINMLEEENFYRTPWGSFYQIRSMKLQ